MSCFSFARFALCASSLHLASGTEVFSADPQRFTHPGDIPVEAFAALPTFAAPRLSPSGQYLAYFTDVDGKRELVVSGFDGGNPLLVTPPEKQTVDSFQWLSNDILLYVASYALKRRSQKVFTTETRVHRLDMKTRSSRWLGAPNRVNLTESTSQLERIVDRLPDDPDHILIELDLNANGRYELYKVNLESGHRKLVEQERAYIRRWRTGPGSEVRMASGLRRTRYVSFLIEPNGDWTNLKDEAWTEHYDVEGFAHDPDRLYVSGQGQYGTRSLFLLDRKTGEIIRTLFEHETYDLDHIIENGSTGTVVGAAYRDDFLRAVYFDEERAAVQRRLDAALPDTVNRILSYAPEKDWYFLIAYSDRNPGQYYVFDRPTGKIQRFLAARPMLDSALMAPTERVDIPVRDGSTIPAYLTRPVNTPLSNLPAIVLPHGGPYGARDTAAWDYEAQFYASRGYLVLKPNFRGSDGYGARFAIAGDSQWGGLMQDDVTDATNWLVRQGYADRERLCIIGTSYGGYAALMGLVKEPGLYRCAVSINGVTDLVRLKSNDRRNLVGGRKWTGHMGLEGTKDKQVSPFHRVDDIAAPVLLIATTDDTRIPWKLSQDMHERLLKAGKASTFLKIPSGDHGLRTAQARMVALKAGEQFLAKHIGE